MSKNGKVQFRLYVAGEAPNSVQARANLIALCAAHFPDRHHVEVVDLLLEPARALEDDVLLTPTLVRLSPKPARKIIGNLNNLSVVLQTLGLSEKME